MTSTGIYICEDDDDDDDDDCQTNSSLDLNETALIQIAEEEGKENITQTQAATAVQPTVSSVNPIAQPTTTTTNTSDSYSSFSPPSHGAIPRPRVTLPSTAFCSRCLPHHL